MKKLVIIGPGGLGGTIAALLAQTDECEVTVVGRSWYPYQYHPGKRPPPYRVKRIHRPG